ncbi:MAG: hypothetical protein VW397_07885 [Candidatus Margulisiibacteriota bacterium]
MHIKKLFLMVISIIVVGCSADDSSNTTSYIGAGSEYSITFSDSSGTFDLTESDSSLAVSGTHTTLPSGFKKLTIGSVSGGGSGGPSVGDAAYGIDIPGVVFLLKPLEVGSEIIAMVTKGSCPTSDFSMNWIITSIDRGDKFSDSCHITSSARGTDALGTFSYTHSTQTGKLPKLFDICDNTVTENVNLGTISCSSGIGSPSEDTDAKMYLTLNGGSIVKLSADNQIIVGLPVNRISTLADMAGDYIGLVMVNETTTSNVYTVKATAETTGIFSFDEINPDSGDVISSNNVNGDATMVAINSPTDGFSTGTFKLDASSTNLEVSCMSNQNINDSGKNFIFCIGQDPFDVDNMVNMLLISK